MSSNSGSGRNRNSKNNNKGRGQQKQQSGQKQNPQKKRNRSRQKKVDPAVFWGDEAKLPNPDSYVISTPDTLAVVRSLGEAPIPGKLAEPYFALVYDRAAMLATVLSHAGGLDDMTPLDPPIEDEPELVDETVPEDDELDDDGGAAEEAADEDDELNE